MCEQCQASLRVCDRYRPLRLIGQGGFGRTFLAVDEGQANHPACVIKQLWPAQFSDPQKIVNLFHQEAQRLQTLGHHPQIPQLLAFQEQDNALFLVQDYIEGQTLAQELAEAERFSPDQVQEVLADMLPLLSFIHDHQVVHRDIKPANIIRRKTDQKLVLVDFGAAKYHTGTALAKTGTSIGSAEYIAPEQARGKAQFASDIYGLGVTCIHLLTGLSPFDLMDGDGMWIWQRLCDQPIAPSLAWVLNKMIAPAISQRYRNVAAAIADLNNPPPLQQQSSPQPPRTRPKILLGSGFALIVFCGLAVFWLIPLRPSEERSTPALPASTIPTSELPASNSATLSLKPATPEEGKALENLVLIAYASGQYYQDHGQFLTQLSQIPSLGPYTLHITKLGNHGLQVSGISKTKKLRSFIVLVWGGIRSSANTPEVPSAQRLSNNPLDDLSLSTLPNLSRDGTVPPIPLSSTIVKVWSLAKIDHKTPIYLQKNPESTKIGTFPRNTPFP